MDLNNLTAVLNSHEEDLFLKIVQTTDDNLHEKAKKIIRRLRLCNRIALYSNAYLKQTRPVCSLERHGCFWEKDIPLSDDTFFKESFRVDRECFDILVEKLRKFEKKETTFHPCIPLDKKIAVALYTLGSSDEYQVVGKLFGISRIMVGKVLNEFCQKVWQSLRYEVLPPEFLSQEKLEECVQGFEEIGFPQCFGAIGVHHIEIKASEDAVDYYNNKGWYSTILFALVDCRCRFLYINVGCPGCCHDSQIYEKSTLKRWLDTRGLFEENSKRIAGQKVPVVILGDSPFQFSDTLMKPYPISTSATIQEKTFNYRFSEARIVAENAFQQIKARFKRIGKGLNNHASSVNTIIKACCVLHNFLNCNNSSINKHWLTENEETNKPQPEFTHANNDAGEKSQQIRNAIATYLCLDDSEFSAVSAAESEPKKLLDVSGLKSISAANTTSHF